jgi:predicted transcriptional regulator of viral defense system
MKFYLEMMKKPVFTIDDIASVYNNLGSGKNYVLQLQKDGYIERIRKNMYTCISPETGLPIANRYQIASAITETSFVSHHTALEYYGVTDQVYYDVYVSSETRFKEFEYDGYTYKCVVTKHLEGIINPPMTKGIKISEIEKTWIESVKDMDKIAGIEEVLSSIELLPSLNEQNLLIHLEKYENQFLYQKVGFILSQYKNQFNLSKKFFAVCKNQAGKSKRYLTKDTKCTTWNKEWKLMIPDNMFNLKNGGMNEFR